MGKVEKYTSQDHALVTVRAFNRDSEKIVLVSYTIGSSYNQLTQDQETAYNTAH